MMLNILLQIAILYRINDIIKAVILEIVQLKKEITDLIYGIHIQMNEQLNRLYRRDVDDLR